MKLNQSKSVALWIVRSVSSPIMSTFDASVKVSLAVRLSIKGKETQFFNTVATIKKLYTEETCW